MKCNFSGQDGFQKTNKSPKFMDDFHCKPILEKNNLSRREENIVSFGRIKKAEPIGSQ